MTSWWTAVAIGVVALSLSYLLRGPLGLAGMAMGLAGTGFSILALALVIGVLGRSLKKEGRATFGTYIVVLAFLIKLPVFVILARAAQSLGGAAPPCFLAGLGLVYLALVGWALAQR